MNKQLQQAKAATQEFMKQHGIDSNTMFAIGQMAQQAIQDPRVYAMLKKQLIGAGILTKQDLPEQTNYMTLAALASMGVLAEQL